jgi:phosphoglycolate phosphatase
MIFHQGIISRPDIMDGKEVAHSGAARLYYFSDVLKLLVFDLDGTLADTRRDLAESVNHALLETGRPVLPLQKVMENVGNGAERLIANCLAAVAPAQAASHEEIKRVLGLFLDHYRDHCLVHTAAYPGVAAALASLRGRRMAVLTNKPAMPTFKILEGLGLSGYFDLAIGGDTRFGRKPEPGGLLHIMASLEAAPQATAMIGDGVQDAGAARSAGTRLIGFLGGIAPRDAMLRERPDAVFTHMEDLPAAVESLEARAANLPESRERRRA